MERKYHPVLQEEVISDILGSLETHKSLAPDVIHPNAPRELVEGLTKPLSLICHQSCLTREVPDNWRLDNVTSIHKKGWKKQPGNLEACQPDLSAREG